MKTTFRTSVIAKPSIAAACLAAAVAALMLAGALAAAGATPAGAARSVAASAPGPAAAGTKAEAAPDDPFRGIENERLLPMLRHLPYEHGGLNVPARDGRFLHDLIVEKGYKRGLEIGTSNGYSGLWLGLAFRRTGGRLITIEVEPKRAEEARRNFEKAGLGDVIDARLNDAFEEIPRLDGTFDFVFIDAWKEDYKKFLDLVLPRVASGGAVTGHNVISHASGMRDFLDAIRAHPDLESAIHGTSSAGISVSIKK
jgi:predicted O-methyltransferase YrrM